ncbi:MAG: septation ring formation regulator EzrA, partial [Erysipelotrichaceae bacterium]|nr:septation ring formation regulator EzrA [Erysipelotrichaceae bacterium]
MNNEMLKEILAMPYVWIGVGAFVILVVLILMVRSSNIKKAKKKLQELEIRYNSLKSVPLSFKLNKSVAIARLNEETMSTVTHCKDDFDLCQSNL